MCVMMRFIGLVCLNIFLLMLYSAAVSAAQLVITEYGGRGRLAYTLTVDETNGIVRECVVVATRISDAKFAFDSTMMFGTRKISVHDTMLRRASLEYLCLADNGFVVDTGKIWQIPWQGQTMCLDHSEWGGIGLKDECERIWASRSMVTETHYSLRTYVKENE